MARNSFHPYRILIAGGPGSEKKSTLQARFYSYAKDPYEGKYKLLINRRESTALKQLNDPKAFIDMD